MHENHYANPCLNEKFPHFQVTRLNITLLNFPKCRDRQMSISHKFMYRKPVLLQTEIGVGDFM